jgi:hypothetical protein
VPLPKTPGPLPKKRKMKFVITGRENSASSNSAKFCFKVSSYRVFCKNIESIFLYFSEHNRLRAYPFLELYQLKLENGKGVLNTEVSAKLNSDFDLLLPEILTQLDLKTFLFAANLSKCFALESNKNEVTFEDETITEGKK